MIAGLGAVLADAEDRRRTIDVYAATSEVATEIAAQFETKNVAVTHSPLPASADVGFLVLRDGEGEFLGSIGLDALDRLLSPEIHPPWVLAETGVDYAAVFDFLDDTLFTSFDRSQMLATAREIEERVWRAGPCSSASSVRRPSPTRKRCTNSSWIVATCRSRSS